MRKNSTVREPMQKRSIEKKEKIIEYGFELICDKGYYNTNTAEIAKAAGVSTGIIYQYFNDKHDILIEGIKQNANNIFFPMLTALEKKFNVDDLENVLRKTIKSFVKDHKLSQTAHEELLAMVHSDKEVAHIFYEFEMAKTQSITDFLIRSGITQENLKEKVHILVKLIDDLCHELVYHKHSAMDYNAMTDITINIIMNMLKI